MCSESARRYTFGQWLDEWLPVKRRQGTRASTLRGYEWLIRQHIRPGLGGIRLHKLTHTDIRHLVEREAESGLSGLTGLRLHDLRHSCASFMLAARASPRAVMKTLGHSQIGLTTNTYTYVLPEIERAAIDAAAKVIFG
jgi:integrase